MEGERCKKRSGKRKLNPDPLRLVVVPYLASKLARLYGDLRESGVPSEAAVQAREAEEERARVAEGRMEGRREVAITPHEGGGGGRRGGETGSTATLATAMSTLALAVRTTRRLLARLWRTFCRLLLSVYKPSAAAHDALLLTLQAAFLFGRSRHFSIYTWLATTLIRRQTMDDMRKQAEAAEAAAAATGWRGRLNKAAGALRTALLLSFVSFKFLEWWLSAPIQERLAETGAGLGGVGVGGGGGAMVRVPPPPPCPVLPAPREAAFVDLEGGGGKVRLPPILAPPEDASCCRICGKVRTNAAASPAGALCCYPCLFAFAKEHGTCPATGMPCSTSQVVRVYLEPLRS